MGREERVTVAVAAAMAVFVVMALAGVAVVAVDAQQLLQTASNVPVNHVDHPHGDEAGHSHNEFGCDCMEYWACITR